MNYQNSYSPVKSYPKSKVIPGGLCWIKFAKHEDVLTWPVINPLTGLCSTALVLKAGVSWLDIFMADTDRIFTETQEEAVPGASFKISLSGYIAGNQAGHVLAAGTSTYHQFVVLFQDRDGLVRLMGDPDTGADFKSIYNSGDRATSRKRSITFNWESTGPALIYSGALGVTPGVVVVPTSHAVRYAVTDLDITAENVDSLLLDGTITVNNSADSFSLTIAVSSRTLVFSEPATEPVKTGYVNGLNNEAIPDYTFDTPVVKAGLRYYYTRGKRSFGLVPTILHV